VSRIRILKPAHPKMVVMAGLVLANQK
jgi:hypothetical protein